MSRKRTNVKSTTLRTITPQGVLRSKAFTIFAAIGIIVIGISLTKQIIRKVEISRQIATLESEINSLEQQNAELNTAIEYFNSSSFQEKEARKKLGLKEEGETVVVLPNTTSESDEAISTTVAESATETSTSNLTKWKNYFFN